MLWSPETDSDAPWFWWDVMNIGYSEQVTDVVDTPGISSGRRIIDSKAMRIMRNQEVQAVVEVVTVEGTSAINVSASVRFLAGN